MKVAKSNGKKLRFGKYYSELVLEGGTIIEIESSKLGCNTLVEMHVDLRSPVSPESRKRFN